MLYTQVDPEPGYEVDYNRWYERDHFYGGCLVGPYLFAGSRWVAPRALKDLRVLGVTTNAGYLARLVAESSPAADPYAPLGRVGRVESAGTVPVEVERRPGVRPRGHEIGSSS